MNPASPPEQGLQLAWHGHQLHRALDVLAQLTTSGGAAPTSPAPPRRRPPRVWLPEMGASLGVDVLERSLSYATLQRDLRAYTPLLVPITDANDETSYLALLHTTRRQATLVTPEGTRQTVALTDVAEWLFAAQLADHRERADDAVQASQAPTERQDALRAAWLQEATQTLHLEGAWQLLPRARQAFDDWRQGRLGLLLGSYLGVRLLWSGLFFAALALVGGGLTGDAILWTSLGAGLAVWLLRLPLLTASAWLERWLALKLGLMTRQRLLGGALRLSVDEVARTGSGSFVNGLLGSQTLIEAWLNRGSWLLSVTGFLLLAGGVLALLGDVTGAVWLLLWVILAWVIVLWFAWGEGRVQARAETMLNGLLERLQGHETRLVQERDWFEASDRDLQAYLRAGRQQDGRLAAAWVWLPYVALLLIVLSLAPDFVTGDGALSTNPAVNVRFAVLLFTLTQIQVLALALPDVALMLALWRQGRRLRDLGYEGNQNNQGNQSNNDGTERATPDDFDANLPGRPLLEATNLTYRYEDGQSAALERVEARIHAGDQILLSGPSGSGKSTLAQLLSGLRNPQTGLRLLRGYDQPTLGTVRWRERVVLVPQFYTNQIFDASLAFNLLMGRRPPHSADDLQEAEALCRDLGLGDLLDRMPLGLQQRVGQYAWPLSHGERNRVFIARALLQRADLTIFDESLAGLDAELLQTVYATLRERASTLLVISHEINEAQA